MTIRIAALGAVLTIALSACAGSEGTGADGSAGTVTPPGGAPSRLADTAAGDTRDQPVVPPDTPDPPRNAGGQPSDDASARAVPPSFQGRYAADGRCGAAGDESGLVITADAVRFHESTGRVVRTAAAGGTLTVVLELTGEGETREAEYRFRREAMARASSTSSTAARACAAPRLPPDRPACASTALAIA